MFQNADAGRKTISALSVLRNHLATAATESIKWYLPAVYRKKKITTVTARTDYLIKLFPKSDTEHPIIWWEYVVGDIQNHAEVGGYKMVG